MLLLLPKLKLRPKKSKSRDVVEEEAKAVAEADTGRNTEEAGEKKKRKKKAKHLGDHLCLVDSVESNDVNLGVKTRADNESMTSEAVDQNNESQPEKRKNKEKKKHQQEQKQDVQEYSVIEQVIAQADDGSGETQKKKKRRKKKNTCQDNGCENEIVGKADVEVKQEEAVIDAQEKRSIDKQDHKKVRKEAEVPAENEQEENGDGKKRKKKRKSDETIEEKLANSVVSDEKLAKKEEIETVEEGGASLEESMKGGEMTIAKGRGNLKRKNSDSCSAHETAAPPMKRAKAQTRQEDEKHDLSYLGSVMLRKETMMRIETKYSMSNFQAFIGSNLHTITGYGHV